MEYIGLLIAMFLCKFCLFCYDHINDGQQKEKITTYKTVTYNGNGLEDLEIRIEKRK